MTLLNEIAALQRMRTDNSDTGEVVPFIYSLINSDGDTSIYLDRYSLQASLMDEECQHYLLHTGFDVDLWDEMKSGFTFGSSGRDVRVLWSFCFRQLRLKARGERK